ncbi:MAG: hypothetical protein NVS2B16_22210 [Chloroflexota bacterium]
MKARSPFLRNHAIEWSPVVMAQRRRVKIGRSKFFAHPMRSRKASTTDKKPRYGATTLSNESPNPKYVPEVVTVKSYLLDEPARVMDVTEARRSNALASCDGETSTPARKTPQSDAMSHLPRGLSVPVHPWGECSYRGDGRGLLHASTTLPNGWPP